MHMLLLRNFRSSMVRNSLVEVRTGLGSVQIQNHEWLNARTGGSFFFCGQVGEKIDLKFQHLWLDRSILDHLLYARFWIWISHIYTCICHTMQYEGGAMEGGRGPSIWDNFTHQYPGTYYIFLY
jgi:hypothetical protein